VRFIYPKINYEEYILLKSNDAFLSKKVTVCSDCYIGILSKYINLCKKPKRIRLTSNVDEDDSVKRNYKMVKYPKRVIE
jgi:hypothetical protein